MDDEKLNKNLNDYEYSFLLIALLFSRKNINDIINFLPDVLQDKIKNKISFFLSLKQSDRIAKIIYELKRLINKNDLNNIKITDEEFEKIKNEPKYLRDILKHDKSKKIGIFNRFLILQIYFKQ